MECDVVYHLFIIDTSEVTFITVHLVIPGLDILFASSFLTVWRLTFILRGTYVMDVSGHVGLWGHA